MGKKTTLAVIISAIGGFLIGFAVGFQEALTISLKRFSGIYNPTSFIFSGLLILLIALGFANKIGETSWIPFRKKKEGDY